MSGFHIPGLGQAKPNESLPPVAADAMSATAAAASAASEEHMADVEPLTTEPPAPATEPAPSSVHETGVPVESQGVTLDHATTEDSMAVDKAESPSLTSALEAAIGGLGETTSEITTTTTAPSALEAAISELGETTCETAMSTTAQSQPLPQEPSGTTELQNDEGENPEWEVDSSPYESSTDSSSSDSSDEGGYELLGLEETARLLMDAEAGGSDDEGERGRPGNANQLRTKNELAEEAIPRPDVTITTDMRIEELGSVEHIVENIMLIKAFTPGEYQVLDTGSVLCNAERVVIGAVAETIGKVLQPMYTVRFNSKDEIKELGVELGAKIFYPVDHASFVFTEPLKNTKGSDASNIHDEEVGDDEMEFSDDEKEAEYKRSIKQRKNKNKAGAGGDGGARGGFRGAHPLRQEVSASSDTLNYDDDDGPYKPLTRPPGFGAGGPSSEPVELPPRPGLHRGGRRGDLRGRGGRGRGGPGRGGRGGGNNQARDGYSQAPQGYGQYPQHAQQPQQQPAWRPVSPQPGHQSQAAPSMPAFGFQFPGWPQPQGQQGVPAPGTLPPPPPPPPPGWPGQQQPQQQQQQQAGGGAFVNPALLAALMSQMQAQGGGQQWGGQYQHPPPS
ncbi:hypothetical protein JDV02_000137 [Purpureocillium takamizusanense]|uniref:H/ACA ribonucleoprotein complex non-core subunit NAF1 n=1 Tax=Purpureocillium takamizusanense TaxID=2060973 RepID=A0A9Q8Q462_9HYPO|nr:uncharacterized protein JDV02_000137 [Purpureocillium takamizusanense]UNI13389.1 hypothetical protein JDV02_000137 [Purpureocillium takamizusanense]